MGHDPNVPALAPEVVLLYQGVDHVRPRDRADFDAPAPNPGHPWLDPLIDGGGARSLW